MMIEEKNWFIGGSRDLAFLVMLWVGNGFTVVLEIKCSGKEVVIKRCEP